MCYAPHRGDLIWLQFDPQAGHEQSGRRPAIVLSPSSYNIQVGLAIVCPITTRRKGYAFEVALPIGLSITGVVLADQAKNLDWRARQSELIGVVADTVVDAVLQKLKLLLFDRRTVR